MKIHEYQAKEILRKYNVPMPKGRVAFSPEKAVKVCIDLCAGGIDEADSRTWVVKAQIHAGGRGKGGGVKIAKTLDDVYQHSAKIYGMNLITYQTGPEGRIVKRLLIEEGISIAKEM